MLLRGWPKSVGTTQLSTPSAGKLAYHSPGGGEGTCCTPARQQPAQQPAARTGYWLRMMPVEAAHAIPPIAAAAAALALPPSMTTTTTTTNTNRPLVQS